MFEATLNEARRVCNLYLKMFTTQARGGKLPHVSGVVKGTEWSGLAGRGGADVYITALWPVERRVAKAAS